MLRKWLLAGFRNQGLSAAQAEFALATTMEGVRKGLRGAKLKAWLKKQPRPANMGEIDWDKLFAFVEKIIQLILSLLGK